MTYDEFLDLLQRLVDDGEITGAEAEELLSRYDEFADIGLALPPESMLPDEDGMAALIIALLIFVLYNTLQRQVARDNIGAVLTRLSYAQRVASFGHVQDLFQAEVSTLAQRLASGAINVSQWQRQFSQAIAVHYRTAAQLAFGSTALSNTAEQALRLEILRQQAFLSRFADHYSLSVMRGEPFSEGYLANRSRMYAGGMRAVSYRIIEMTYADTDGWVVYYIAVDDERTCSECMDAMVQGPYLMGNGPHPGEVCLGRDRCRCRREPIYDPQAYQSLVRP